MMVSWLSWSMPGTHLPQDLCIAVPYPTVPFPCVIWLPLTSALEWQVSRALCYNIIAPNCWPVWFLFMPQILEEQQGRGGILAPLWACSLQVTGVPPSHRRIQALWWQGEEREAGTALNALSLKCPCLLLMFRRPQSVVWPCLTSGDTWEGSSICLPGLLSLPARA